MGFSLGPYPVDILSTKLKQLFSQHHQESKDVIQQQILTHCLKLWIMLIQRQISLWR